VLVVVALAALVGALISATSSALLRDPYNYEEPRAEKPDFEAL
jgi:hypothetical protein